MSWVYGKERKIEKNNLLVVKNIKTDRRVDGCDMKIVEVNERGKEGRMWKTLFSVTEIVD